MRIPCYASCLLALICAVSAQAAVHRCESADGVSIYTDRPCAEMDAVPRNLQPPSPDPAATPDAAAEPAIDTGPVRTGCARVPDTLLFDVRRAVENRDVNRLAGLYHWPGTGSRSARHVMDRLQHVVGQPLASIDLVYPEPPTELPADDVPVGFMPLPPEEPLPGDPGADSTQDPVAIRIQRYEPGQFEPGPSQQLQLVRFAECWWVRF